MMQIFFEMQKCILELNPLNSLILWQNPTYIFQFARIRKLPIGSSKSLLCWGMELRSFISQPYKIILLIIKMTQKITLISSIYLLMIKIFDQDWRCSISPPNRCWEIKETSVRCPLSLFLRFGPSQFIIQSKTLPSANSEDDSDHDQEPHQGNMIDALEMTLTMTMVIWKLPSRWPQETETECVAENRMSSFGFLGFVVSAVNAVVNVANNINNNNNNRKV